MKYYLLFLTLFVQINVLTYADYTLKENCAQQILNDENYERRERECPFRYYDPNSGSYLSQDLIGLEGNNPTL